MEHYQVKWTDAEGVHYGIYRCETKKKPGYADVDDAVMPYYHVVPIKDLVDIEMGKLTFTPGELGGSFDDEFAKFVDASYKAAVKLSDSLGKGIAVGKLITIGVADGMAAYVVTKVTKSTVTVGWRGFCPDRYTDQVLGAGGSFPRRSIEPLVRRHDGLKAIFG
jgi:hypothetical protein